MEENLRVFTSQQVVVRAELDWWTEWSGGCWTAKYTSRSTIAVFCCPCSYNRHFRFQLGSDCKTLRCYFPARSAFHYFFYSLKETLTSMKSERKALLMRALTVKETWITVWLFIVWKEQYERNNLKRQHKLIFWTCCVILKKIFYILWDYVQAQSGKKEKKQKCVKTYACKLTLGRKKQRWKCF